MNGADQFQEVIFAKTNAPEVVRRELGRRSWRGDNVVIGTATDPYQQAESKYRITRGIPEAFRDFPNPVSITTKSPMVLRDLDLLAELARHAEVTVHFTVTTLDEALWRKIEPTTSKPYKRIEAMRTLREHGVRSGIFLSPVLPGLTDDTPHLEAVIAAAAQAVGDDIQLNGINLELSDNTTQLKGARQAAISAAAARARVWAELAGRHLGKVLSVSEVVGNQGNFSPCGGAGGGCGGGGGTPIQAGQANVTVDVAVVYELTD